MKLLVFEYSSVCLDDNLVFEGFHMLRGLLNDLEHVSFFDTYFLIDEKLDVFSYENCKSICLDCELFEWLDTYINQFDYCLFVAPEDNLIQYRLTSLLEEKNIKILCPDSRASFVCSSKYLTYNNIPDDILKINTLKMKRDSVDLNKIEEDFKYNFIIKPDDRTSSDLIYHITNKDEFESVLNVYSDNNINTILIQEYLSGESVSVSVVCYEDDVNCISVNSQMIKSENNCLEYIGCTSPIEHDYKTELYDISKRIIKEVPGLKGFVGIDYIIHDKKIYFVEINSRITTPFIILQEKCNENLTENIIKTIHNKKTEKITFNGKGKFIKTNNIGK